MSRKRKIQIVLRLIILVFLALRFVKSFNINPTRNVSEKLDSLNGEYVYYNGGVNHIEDRNLSPDGYNIGLKYQCVEFIKRYYYNVLNHKMPDSYGHAVDFFDKKTGDGEINLSRNLLQFSNPGISKPQVNDILVFDSNFYNRYGHVAIISQVTENTIEIIQQNPGPFGNSRETFALAKKNELWEISNDRILGWLRKQQITTID